MDDVEFQNMLGVLTSLLPSQLVALDAAVRTQIAPAASPTPHAAPSIAAIEAHFADAPECPHCRSTAVKRWGSANGLGRYRCKQCGVTFNA
jgi:transposase-like protein